jgi:hypothetical protein
MKQKHIHNVGIHGSIAGIATLPTRYGREKRMRTRFSFQPSIVIGTQTLKLATESVSLFCHMTEMAGYNSPHPILSFVKTSEELYLLFYLFIISQLMKNVNFLPLTNGVCDLISTKTSRSGHVGR